MDMQAQQQHSIPTVSEQPFTFTGTGGEYFRIWIVNLFLNIVTLGIFSAWAKVRRLQYFYRNTHIGDASFDYHGSPIAILKGRVIGFLLFALYSVTIQFSAWGLLIALIIGLMMPFFLVMSFRFRLYNTSFRGLRFGFAGSVKDAYIAFFVLPLAAMFTGYLLAPLAHHRMKSYQHNNSRFGQASFSFTATEGSFFLVYLFAFLQAMGVVLALVAGGALLAWGRVSEMDQQKIIILVILGFYGAVILTSLFIFPYFTSRIQNLIWNHTQLGENRFRSTMTAKGLAWIIFSNLFLTIITLGLYKPFAAIRMARYHVENMALLPAGDMDAYIASEQQKAGAAGMETAEVFDIDVGF